jgi:hypothetical protein
MNEEVDNVEVYRISGEDIRKTGISQCETHTFRKLSENEVACTVCPTALIVENVEEYL